MAKMKFVYLYIAEGADPKINRTIASTPDTMEITVLGVSTYDEAVVECKQLVKEGVTVFELCPGFGHIGVGKITEAVGNDAVVGVVRFDKIPFIGCKSGDVVFK